MVFTTRLAGGKRRPQRLRGRTRRLGVVQKNSRPNHPTTCGKVERFQQTLKKWLAAQPAQPATITELQALIDALRRRTTTTTDPTAPCPTAPPPPSPTPPAPKPPPPAAATTTPTTGSATTASTTPAVVTLRHDGQLHHIGIGRTHARTHVILLVHDLDIRVIHAATGELLRELTLDPTKDYQPQNTKQTEPLRGFGLSPMS